MRKLSGSQGESEYDAVEQAYHDGEQGQFCSLLTMMRRPSICKDRVIPSSIIAGMFNFKSAVLFDQYEAEREVKVSFTGVAVKIAVRLQWA